ncbi:MAG: hypothetical protein ACREEB_15615 [Caulobacteraceae bacterium]
MIRGLALAFAILAAAPALAARNDPYEALKAMNGHWIVTGAHGHTETIDNNCARTGLFFVCEQAVGGKPAALVIFLPKGHEERKLTFRTQTLTSAGDRPGPWRDLTIDGDTWTYADADRPVGAVRKVRTVITHSGPDYMHAEVQATMKGDNWIVLSSENFNRAR